MFRASDGKTTGECEVGQGDRDAGLPVVSLVPADRWWFATWYGDGTGSWIAVDVSTPPTLVDREWTYVDLELDPHRSWDGSVWIADEDDFVAACDAGIISPHEQVAARAAANEVKHLLRMQREPFGTVGWQWLRDAVAMPLAPLTVLSSHSSPSGT